MSQKSVALFTVAEAAATMNISKPTLYRLFATGQLSWVQVGAHRRVAATEIDRFIAEHTQAAS